MRRYRRYQLDVPPLLYRVGVFVLSLAIAVVGTLAAIEVFKDVASHGTDDWEKRYKGESTYWDKQYQGESIWNDGSSRD